MTAHIFTGCLVLFATPPQAELSSQLEEVMANVRAQSLGTGTVDDLALPEDLLRRLSDRILRRSFEDHFRIVVAEAAAAPVGSSALPVAPDEKSAFRKVMDVLALLSLGVLTVLGFFAWRARARRKS